MIRKFIDFCAQQLGHHRFPLVLALLAALSMLPSLKAGLFGDDLVQRLAQFKASDLPPRVLDTGFVPPNSGELSAVVTHLFNYLGRGRARSEGRIKTGR